MSLVFVIPKYGNQALTNGSFYNNDGNAGDTTYGALAKVAYDVAVAIEGATNHSLCAISKSDAEDLVSEYESYSGNTRLNKSTIYTWADKTKSSKANFLFEDIMVQLGKIADGSAPSSYIHAAKESSSMLVVVVITSIISFTVIGSFFFIRKRKASK